MQVKVRCMTDRPISVSVIAWTLCICGILAIFIFFMQFISATTQKSIPGSSVPVQILRTVSLMSVVIHVACGYFILRGRKLARTVFLFWVPIQLLFNLVTLPLVIPAIIDLLKFLTVSFYLFRPMAQAFFNGNAA